jgi:glycosyltransferase involved in cell wall biosynthesis
MPSPRVLIACSGVGHVRRGNEAWAIDVATALHAAGVDVVLAGGGPNPGAPCPYRRLPSLPRDFPIYRRVVSWSRRYLAEQLSFMLSARRWARAHRPRIVHFCDPDLALQFVKRTPEWRARVIFKDGMLLGPLWCRRMPNVQVLAPYYRDVLPAEHGVSTEHWHVIPHLVDTEKFRPPESKTAARAQLSSARLNPEDFVVLGVGDYSQGGNKRLDWLVREVAALPADARARLVLAGQASPEDFARFEAGARPVLGDRLHLLRNLPREEVSRLYQAADAYAHAAIREPFGIVFLEAMASGLPIVGHVWEVTRWIIGDAGETVDMSQPGALAETLRRWSSDPARRRLVGEAARRRAMEHFSPARIVPLYESMYASVEARPDA